MNAATQRHSDAASFAIVVSYTVQLFNSMFLMDHSPILTYRGRIILNYIIIYIIYILYILLYNYY